MQNYLHEISYIAYVLIHFYKELAIERSLLNRVGCVVTWVTWVHGLRGSNFQVGWVGYAGQNIFYLGHNFCVGQIYFCVGLWVGPIFLRRIFFGGGSAFCTRWDYFSILQLIVWAFFSWVSSQQILTKPCLTTLVFLGGLIEICKIDEIQWHYMNVWLNSTCELQNDLILKEDPSTAKSPSHPTLPKLLLKISFIYGNFFKEKSFRKNAVSCLK